MKSFSCFCTSLGCTLAVSFLVLLLSDCHIYSYFHWTHRTIESVCSREAGLPQLGLGGGGGAVMEDYKYMSGVTTKPGGEVESVERCSKVK